MTFRDPETGRTIGPAPPAAAAKRRSGQTPGTEKWRVEDVLIHINPTQGGPAWKKLTDRPTGISVAGFAAVEELLKDLAHRVQQMTV